MALAKHIATLSRCKRKQVGSIIVKDGNIISFGYNGTCPGEVNCCEDHKGNTKQNVIHAELNAILKCGTQVKDADLYVTLSPCLDCCKLIKAAGIKKVYFSELYRDISGLKKYNINYEILLN